MSPILKEKIAYNFLNIINNGDYFKLQKLFQKYNSWLKALQKECKEKDKAIKEYKILQNKKINLILNNEKNFPKLLKEIPLAPFGIYVKGNFEILNQKAIAIVGTRKAGEEGKIIARNFAKKLSQSGLIIVSGLALGIDSFAHLGCLDANNKTVAVLGTGLLNIYPKINEKIAQKILNLDGAIISEYNIYSPALPYRFLERNRLISGLSLGVLIVEAPKESGALNTARFAIEQNREVWVIPGSINNLNFYGSNKLIQQGANLVMCPEDILSALNIEFTSQNQNEILNLNFEEKIIYETIKNFGKPIDIDKIIELTHLKIQTVNQALSKLIIKNIIKETEKGYII
jgi:DNA processing protein